MLLTDDLLHWLEASDCSFEWICVGDPKVMTPAYRQARISEKPFKKVLERLSEEETRLLLVGLRANMEHGIPLEDALAAVKVLMDERKGAAA